MEEIVKDEGFETTDIECEAYENIDQLKNPQNMNQTYIQ